MVTAPIIDPETKIDFYASNDRSYRSLLPVWDALQGRQGTFFASRHVHFENVLKVTTGEELPECRPIVVSSYKDLHDIYTNIDPDRAIIMYEKEHETEFKGLLKIVSLFLCQDQRTASVRRSISDDVLFVADERSAAQYIVNYVKGVEPETIEAIGTHSVGLVYMAFGDKAKQAVKNSVMSLQRLGYKYPVFVVSEENWKGETPFDLTQRKNFQFRAGRIKPFLYQYTPFDYNLYLDADTKFLKPIHEGFELLESYDLVLTEEKLCLKELYNKHLAGWELNMLERDVTVIETGGDDLRKFINSGVFFFKQNKKTAKLFQDWYSEWLRFQEWDEQLSLMRSLSCNDVSVKYLPVEWNSPHLNPDAYIFHNYGRGTVRTNQ